MIELKKLIEEGIHFGHKTSRWHPKMAPYIWGSRSNIHLIDVSKTARQLQKAAEFLESVAQEGKTILWVGTKKVAQPVVTEIAERLGYPYVTHRWIGGTLTNFSQVKKSITKLLHLEDVVKKADHSMFTKKELVSLQKLVDRLAKNVGSIRAISWPIGAVVVVDAKKEQTALREAREMGIPVVGIVDTNTDPSLVDYVIPANDDLQRGIQLLLDQLAQAIEKGQAKAAEKPAEVKQEATEVEASTLIEEDVEPDTTSAEEKPQVKKMKTKEPATKVKKGSPVRSGTSNRKK